MTLIEILVGLLLTVLVFAIFRVSYRTLARSSLDVSRTTDIQREVKAVSRELASDLKRAGFGITGIDIFTTLDPDKVKFLYRDLVGTYCAADDTVIIGYSADGKSLTKNVSCAGVSKPVKVIDFAPDSLSLVFAYRDENGASTGASAAVRTVEFSLDVVSNPSWTFLKRHRSSKASIGIVNNL